MKFTRIAAIALVATSLTSGVVFAETHADTAVNTAMDKAMMEKTPMAQPAMEKAAAPLPSQDFVKKATIGNTFEITSSKLALQRSKNADVKAFAQQMITDHTKAGNDMKPAIKASKVKPVAMKLDTLHQGVVNDLKKAPAAEFDAKYIDAQNNAHDETIALFNTYLEEGKDQPLKDFADATLPTLQQHKDQVVELKDKMAK